MRAVMLSIRVTTAAAPADISAQASRLDVLALLTRHNKTAYWATQVR